MSKEEKFVIGAGTIMRGNYALKNQNKAEIFSSTVEKSAETLLTEDFEKRAREQIGGSIAFVTKLKNSKHDVLLWDGED